MFFGGSYNMKRLFQWLGLSVGTPIFSIFLCSIFCISGILRLTYLTVTDGCCSSRHHMVTQKIHQKRHYSSLYLSFLKKKGNIFQQLLTTFPLRVIGPEYMHTLKLITGKELFWLKLVRIHTLR